MMFGVSRTRQTSGLVSGSCLLLLYLVTATPLAPVAIALLAGMDRSHHVALRQTTQGRQVVLRHDCPTSPSPRHGMLARALTVFAQEAAAPQSDHVIQVGAMDTAQQAPALEIEPASNSDPDASIEGDSELHAPGMTFEIAAFPRPPPVPSGLLLTIRSTVFLI